MTRLAPIALIGFGEVGQLLAEDLARTAVDGIGVYDIAFREESSAAARAIARTRADAPIGDLVTIQCPLITAESAASAVRGARLVISAVTAAQTLEAARSVSDGLSPGAFYLDLNSCAPGQKQAAAAAIEAAGGRFVEAAVMSPIAARRIASPMLLGGPHATAFARLARPLGFQGARAASEEIGKVSAIKMCRSVIIKGMEALLTESLLSARRYGVEDTVLASLSDLLPAPDWPDLARYMISRSLQHGARRAEEMAEAARTVEEAGVAPILSLAIAQRQAWAAERKGALSSHLGAMLDAINGETAV